MDGLVGSGIAFLGVIFVVVGILYATQAFLGNDTWVGRFGRGLAFGAVVGVPLAIAAGIAGWIFGDRPSSDILTAANHYWLVKPTVAQLIVVLNLQGTTAPGLWAGLGAGAGLGAALGLGLQRRPRAPKGDDGDDLSASISAIARILSAVWGGISYIVGGFLVGLAAASQVGGSGFGAWFYGGGPTNWLLTGPLGGFTSAFQPAVADELVYGAAFGLVIGLISGFAVGVLAEWLSGLAYLVMHLRNAGDLLDPKEFTKAATQAGLFVVAVVAGVLIGLFAGILQWAFGLWPTFSGAGPVGVIIFLIIVILALILVLALDALTLILIPIGLLLQLLQQPGEALGNLLGLGGLLLLAVLFVAFQGATAALRNAAPEQERRSFDWYGLFGGVAAGLIVTLVDNFLFGIHVESVAVAVGLGAVLGVGLGLALALLPRIQLWLESVRQRPVGTVGGALAVVGVVLFSLQFIVR